MARSWWGKVWRRHGGVWSGEGIPKGCSLLTGSEVEGWGSEKHVGGHWFTHLKMKEKALEPLKKKKKQA